MWSWSLDGASLIPHSLDGWLNEDALKLFCKSRSPLTHDADIFVKF